MYMVFRGFKWVALSGTGRFRALYLSVLGMGVSSFVAPVSYSASFGIYDARGLAMGGATVAAASSDQAQYYNPALLAFEEEDEDESRNGRFIFPQLVVQVSDAAQDTIDIIDEDYDVQLTDAINAFNANQNEATAASVLDAARNLDQAIDDIGDDSIDLDGYFGLTVTEPADREGGSFYVGVRVIGRGESNTSAEDRALLATYIDTLENYSVGEDLPDELADGTGLIDPRGGLTSTADVAGIAIGEWGLALSKQFSFWGQPIALGVTPKLMQVEVYREQLDFVDDTLSFGENRRTHLTGNVDIGIALSLFEHYRIGFAVKDLISKEFESENGLAVELDPRARLGFAYVNRYLTAGLDIDVVKNTALATEEESQEAALGLEFSPWSNIDLRFGYRQDLAGERDDILSAGLRYQVWRFVGELSYAQSKDIQGGALQIGWAF